MSINEYLSSFFISDEDIQTHKDVAAAQSAILARQIEEGKRGPFEAYAMQREIDLAGTELERDRDKNSNPFKIVPWWVWVLGSLAIWFYLGAPGLRQLKGKFR